MELSENNNQNSQQRIAKTVDDGLSVATSIAIDEKPKGEGQIDKHYNGDLDEGDKFQPYHTKAWQFALVLCFLLSFWIWDLADTSGMQDDNVNWVSNMQDDHGESTDDFFRAVTALGKGVFLGPAMLGIILFADPQTALYLITINTLTSVTNAWLKMIYRRPRPYWLDTDVESRDGCPASFGMPSGHAMMGITTLIYTPIFLFHFYGSKNITSNKFIKFPLYFLCVSMALLVGFSRVYLGVHSFGQVLIGWGFGMLVVAVLQAKPVWDILWGKVITKDPIDFNVALKFTAAILTFAVVFVVTYAIVSGWDPPQSWLNNIHKTCEDFFDKESWERFQKHHLPRVDMLGLILSGYWGYYLAFTKQNLAFDWNRGQPKQLALTVGIILVICAVAVGILLLIGEPGTFAVAIIYMLILCLIGGFLAFWAAPKIGTEIKRSDNEV